MQTSQKNGLSLPYLRLLPSALLEKLILKAFIAHGRAVKSLKMLKWSGRSGFMAQFKVFSFANLSLVFKLSKFYSFKQVLSISVKKRSVKSYI